MRTSLLLVLIVAAASGCTFSVHPILNTDDLTTDIDLTGTWKHAVAEGETEPDDPEKWTLQGFANNSSYDATGNHSPQEFIVDVGRLGEQRYLQFTRSDRSLSDDSPILSGVPVYGFARFELEGDELRVYPIRDQTVGDLLTKHAVPFRIFAPSDMGRWCIITAETRVLQQLIGEQSDLLFATEPTVLRR